MDWIDMTISPCGNIANGWMIIVPPEQQLDVPTIPTTNPTIRSKNHGGFMINSYDLRWKGMNIQWAQTMLVTSHPIVSLVLELRYRVDSFARSNFPTAGLGRRFLRVYHFPGVFRKYGYLQYPKPLLFPLLNQLLGWLGKPSRQVPAQPAAWKNGGHAASLRSLGHAQSNTGASSGKAGSNLVFTKRQARLVRIIYSHLIEVLTIKLGGYKWI